MTASTLPRRTVLVMAVGTGAAVANNYYGQPLLHPIADTFGIAPTTAGFIVTASQLGYAIGLLFLVPLGDLVERRGLVVRLLLGTAAALALTAAAPTLAVLFAALAAVGLTTVVSHVLAPLAATLAGEEDRGRVVGIVMSGLLIGILIARTISGLVAELLGWRGVYALASVVILVLAMLLRRELPVSRPDAGSLTYPTLLRSVGQLLRTSPVLRRRMVYGATGMASFSLLWTSLTLLLADPPYGYGEATIGLFGLFGLAGALSAQAAGRLADAGHLDRATGAFLVAIVAGWTLLAFGDRSLTAILAGLVVFDLGVQGAHICNQHRIYGEHPDARGRVTTAYMVGNFACGALGSAGAAIAYAAGGWTAIWIAGSGVAVLAVGVWVAEQTGRRVGRRA